MKFRKVWYGLLTILLALVLFWLVNSYLIVKNIECFLDHQSCPDQLLAQTTKLLNRQLLLTDFEGVITHFAINQPLKYSRLQKKLPQTLIIEFETIPIVYQLKFSSQIFDVTSQGKLFEKKVSLITEILINDQLFDQVIEKGAVKPQVHLQIIQALKLLDTEQQKIIKFAYLNSESIVLILENNPQILLDPQNMIKSLSQYFRLIKPEIANYSTPIMEVDLRFKYPILRSVVSKL